MDAALLFRDGNALHAVDTRFIAQRAVGFGSARREDRFFQTAERALGEGEDVDLPAAPLAEACVHAEQVGREQRSFVTADRKSTRLNSSHSQISYAVFCLNI